MVGKKYKVILVIFAALVFSQCGGKSYVKEMQESEKLFYKEKYKEAARKLLPAVNTSGKDQLLYQMECGLMLHAGGDFKTSNKVLLSAGKIADRITTSVSKQIASVILNETTTNYKGEDFERVLLHMYLGINFLMLDDSESARVEFRKVNEQLKSLRITGKKKYKQNIMAKYLTAVAFEIIGDKDNDDGDREFAYIEYKQIHKLNPKFKLVQQDLVRLSKKLGDTEEYNSWKRKFGEKNIPKNSGELVVVYQAGRGAIKKSRGSLISDKAMMNGIRISLNGMTLKQGVTIGAILFMLKKVENPIPRFIKRSNKVKAISISANGRNLGRTIMMEDIESTAVRTLKAKYSTLYMKFAAGIAAKAAIAVGSGMAAKKIAQNSKQFGQVAGCIGAAVGAGVGVGLVSQIKPDLRCWHTLPANLQLSRYFLKPGEYEFNIKLLGSGNRVITTRKQKIKIEKGKKSFLNFRTLF